LLQAHLDRKLAYKYCGQEEDGRHAGFPEGIQSGSLGCRPSGAKWHAGLDGSYAGVNSMSAVGRQPLPTTDSFLASWRPDLDLAINNYSCLIKG
jgi:hypothetical protein